MRALPLCALAAFAAVGCRFSGDEGGVAYACDRDDQCPAGQTCQSGRCAVPGQEADAAPPPSWWDEDWLARTPLSIENVSSASLPAGFQIGWSIDLPGSLGESQFDAVRVLAYDPAGDDWSEIPRVIDGAGAAAGDDMVWFPLPAALEPDASAVVWIYLGNPEPPAPAWTGGDVFEMVAAFSAPASLDRWVSEGAVAIEGGELRFDSAAEMRSADPWPVDRAVDITARISDTADRLWFGFQREVPDFDPDVPWAVWIRREAGDRVLPEYAGPEDTVETRWSGATVAIGTEPHVFTVERLVDRIVYRLDHAVASADHDHPLDADHSAPLYIRFSNTGASSFWLSRVRVRHAAYPPPELTLGAREDVPAR